MQLLCAETVHPQNNCSYSAQNAGHHTTGVEHLDTTGQMGNSGLFQTGLQFLGRNLEFLCISCKYGIFVIGAIILVQKSQVSFAFAEFGVIQFENILFVAEYTQCVDLIATRRVSGVIPFKLGQHVLALLYIKLVADVDLVKQHRDEA